VANGYNPIFEKIFSRVEQDGDEIIAYIAYGLYKERKRDFLVARQKELAGAVPQGEIDTFHRTYDEGQIDLVWGAAKESLAVFAVNYADAEKNEAVNAALAAAVKGRFWHQVGITTAANFIFAVGVIVLYFLLRFIGFDLIDKLRKLEQIFPT
jgi:hypothetical protein